MAADLHTSALGMQQTLSVYMIAFAMMSLLAVDIRPLRSLVAGLSAGWAAHLLFATFTGSVAVMFMPGLLGTLWMLGNGLFLIFLASVLGEEQP